LVYEYSVEVVRRHLDVYNGNLNVRYGWLALKIQKHLARILGMTVLLDVEEEEDAADISRRRMIAEDSSEPLRLETHSEALMTIEEDARM
jgi:hypothetical protein